MCPFNFRIGRVIAGIALAGGSLAFDAAAQAAPGTQSSAPGVVIVYLDPPTGKFTLMSAFISSGNAE